MDWNSLYLGIYMYVHMHVYMQQYLVIKRDHGFEGSKEGLVGGLGEVKGEGTNVIVLFLKITKDISLLSFN